MDLSEFLLAWRTAALPDREVIDALVHPAHAGPSPALAAALARWPGTSYWSDEPDGRHLILTRRRYQLDVSPPSFIPAPVAPWPIGTMGAFTRLRTVVSDRRQLLDVGIAGPIAGLVVALPVLAIGLAMSHPPAAGSSLSGMLLGLDDGNAVLGDSILTLALRHLVRGSTPAIVLHPVAFAGWLGVFVTMLNLLPISQLDGGHVLYAALPRWHARVAVGFWALIVALGAYWRGWLLWGTVVLVLSRGRLGHPPVLDGPRPLPRSRTLLAWIALILFLATFTPVPFRI